MNTERLKELEILDLQNGSHESVEKGLCIMEAVAYVAGEPHSDHPKCACPILTEYAMRLNDRFTHEDRQKLKPLIPLLVGTRLIDEVQIARKMLIMWRNVTSTYPLILDILKLREYADQLRSFPNTKEGMTKAAAFLRENWGHIRKVAYADAYADANAYAYAYAYAYADAYANAYADANAYAYANAYANAYADADANAYAIKLRSAIADSAIETLKMACEVGK